MTTRRPASVWLSVTLFIILPLIEALPAEHLKGSSVNPLDSVRDAADYLASVQDAYHGDRFWIYEDLGSPGNHFHSWALFPSPQTQAEMVGSHTETVHSGATSIRCSFSFDSPFEFGGFNMLNGILPPGAAAPQANFGEIPAAGITELVGAHSLVFHARGEKGGERVDFFTLGVGVQEDAPYPDSSAAVHLVPEGTVELSKEWTRYEIPLDGAQLSYVLGGFGWGASGLDDADGDHSIVFFVDDIYFQLSPSAAAKRVQQPRFLRSFTTSPHQSQPAPVGDFDFVLRNTAFTYDNALALLAFLAAGGAENLRRARLIGDAFLYAVGHDRSYTDGRVRDAYSAGDIALPPGWLPNGKGATVPVPGFFDTDERTFFEIFQDGISTGNNAWAMIALLGLHRRTSDARYLSAALRIGEFIRSFRNDAGSFQGFQGGLDNPETMSATMRPWASTEHNLDIYAAFATAYQLTGDRSWLKDALHARAFVQAMRDSQSGCFYAGTTDPQNRNTMPGQLPLDTQSWSVLALAGSLMSPRGTLDCAEANHGLEHHGFLGFDFNEDRDGVWFEGTAQMATAYHHLLDEQSTQRYRTELARAQHTSPTGDGLGIAAACHDGVSTGFQDRPGVDFLLFRRLHLAATSWNIFAQLGFNPFYQTTTPTAPLTRIVFPQAVVGRLGGQSFEIDLSLVNSNPSAPWTGTMRLLQGSDLSGMQEVTISGTESQDALLAEGHPILLPAGGALRYSIASQNLQVGVLLIESHDSPAEDLTASFFYRLKNTGNQIVEDLIAVQPNQSPSTRLESAYTRSPSYNIGLACVAETSLASLAPRSAALTETHLTISIVFEDGSAHSGAVTLGGSLDAHRAFLPHEVIPDLPQNISVATLRLEASDPVFCTLLAVGQPPEFGSIQIAATPALTGMP